MSKIHPDDPRITAYVLNELDDDERNVFEQALVASAELRTAVDEVRATIVRLESAFAEEAAAFDSHEEATVPVTSSEAAVPSPDLTEDNRKGSPRSWFAILTIAAIVLLSVSMAVIQWQNRSDVALQQNDKLSSGTDLIYELDQKNDSTNQNRKSVEQSIAQDVSTKESESLNNQFDELTDLITETTDSETWVELRGEDRVTEFASNLSAVVSNTSEVEDQDLDLDGIESNDMLMVTPRIIVEDGEESILGESLVENKTPYAVNNIARQTTSPQPRPEIVPIDNLVTGTYVKLPKHIG
ncbi:MAG: hypothetical protein KDA87_18330, partial [Planctomycetales bacterium]|nr:hypothetical protein [Planctomycetales bacterium]